MHREVRRALAKGNMSEFAYLMVFVYVGIALGILVWAALNFSAAQDRAAARGYKQGYDTATNHAVDNIKKLKGAGWAGI